MSRRIIAGVAAAGIAILAACSPDKSPNVSLPTEASLAKVPAPPSCSFSTANSDGRLYFANSSGPTKDQAFVLLDAMQSAYNAGGAAGATNAGFAVLNRLAAAVGTAAVKGTAAQGSTFANDVLLCMSVAGYVNANPVDFSGALGAGGLFAVRTNTDTAVILARSGAYGAQPTPTGATWPVPGPTLFYGFPLAPNPLFQNDPRVGTVFDLKTLPSPLTFTPKVRVGVCDLSQDGRILHLHGNDPAVVLSVDLPTFCQTTSTSSTQAPSSMFALAAHELASWLTPKPAYAASRMMFAAFGGGTVGGFSLIGPIQVLDTLILSPVPNAAVSDTALSYDNDPLSNQFGSGGLTVLAQTKGGHNPLAGVLIKLTIVNNKGSFVPSPFETATTDETGIARFPRFFVDKAGGYTITASAPDDFGTAGAFVSNLFNVNGQ